MLHRTGTFVLVVVAGLALTLSALRLRRLWTEASDWLAFRGTSASKRLPQVPLEVVSGNREGVWPCSSCIVFLDRTDCRDCSSSYPWLDSLSSVAPVVVVGTGDRSALATHASERGWTFPVMFDSTEALLGALELRGTPGVVIVDSQAHARNLASGRKLVPAVLRYVYRTRRDQQAHGLGQLGRSGNPPPALARN